MIEREIHPRHLHARIAVAIDYAALLVAGRSADAEALPPRELGAAVISAPDDVWRMLARRTGRDPGYVPAPETRAYTAALAAVLAHYIDREREIGARLHRAVERLGAGSAAVLRALPDDRRALRELDTAVDDALVHLRDALRIIDPPTEAVDANTDTGAPLH